jgi:hypothetical protein
MICKKNFGWFLLSGILACMLSCQNPSADSAAVRQELRKREIVHLNQGQISERAVQIADSLLLQADSDFLKRLKTNKETQSCLPALDSSLIQLGQRYPVQLRYHLFDPKKISQLRNTREKQLMDACLYSKTHKFPLNPNLQKDGEKEFIYTRVLTLSSPECQNCHLNASRPELRGKTGDTIGIKMLRLSRKQVVMSFVE